MQRSITDTPLLVLLPFRATCAYLLETVKLDGVVLKRIESGDIPATGTEAEQRSFKQLIVVSALGKLALCAESLAALWTGLRIPKNLPGQMLRYKTKVALEFLARAANLEIGTEEIWSTLAFPDLEALPLSAEEKDLARRVLEASVRFVRTVFQEIGQFYLANEVIYSKYKHGLVLIPGFGQEGDVPPLCLALDHKARPLVPMIPVFPEDGTPFHPWFRVMALLPYDSALFNQYSGLIDRMQVLIRNIVDGHQARIANCGLDYLPPNLMMGPDFSDHDWQAFRTIAESKIVPNQAAVDLSGTYRLNLGPESRAKILAAFRKNHLANFHFQDAPSAGESGSGVLRAKHELSTERIKKGP